MDLCNADDHQIKKALLVYQAHDADLYGLDWPAALKERTREIIVSRGKEIYSWMLEDFEEFNSIVNKEETSDEYDIDAALTIRSSIETYCYLMEVNLPSIQGLDAAFAGQLLERWKVVRNSQKGRWENRLPNHWWLNADQQVHRDVVKGFNPSVLCS